MGWNPSCICGLKRGRENGRDGEREGREKEGREERKGGLNERGGDERRYLSSAFFQCVKIFNSTLFCVCVNASN